MYDDGYNRKKHRKRKKKSDKDRMRNKKNKDLLGVKVENGSGGHIFGQNIASASEVDQKPQLGDGAVPSFQSSVQMKAGGVDFSGKPVKKKPRMSKSTEPKRPREPKVKNGVRRKKTHSNLFVPGGINLTSLLQQRSIMGLSKMKDFPSANGTNSLLPNQFTHPLLSQSLYSADNAFRKLENNTIFNTKASLGQFSQKPPLTVLLTEKKKDGPQPGDSLIKREILNQMPSLSNTEIKAVPFTPNSSSSVLSKTKTSPYRKDIIKEPRLCILPKTLIIGDKPIKSESDSFSASLQTLKESKIGPNTSLTVISAPSTSGLSKSTSLTQTSEFLMDPKDWRNTMSAPKPTTSLVNKHSTGVPCSYLPNERALVCSKSIDSKPTTSSNEKTVLWKSPDCKFFMSSEDTLDYKKVQTIPQQKANSKASYGSNKSTLAFAADKKYPTFSECSVAINAQTTLTTVNKQPIEQEVMKTLQENSYLPFVQNHLKVSSQNRPSKLKGEDDKTPRRRKSSKTCSIATQVDNLPLLSNDSSDTNGTKIKEEDSLSVDLNNLPAPQLTSYNECSPNSAAMNEDDRNLKMPKLKQQTPKKRSKEKSKSSDRENSVERKVDQSIVKQEPLDSRVVPQHVSEILHPAVPDLDTLKAFNDYWSSHISHCAVCSAYTPSDLQMPPAWKQCKPTTLPEETPIWVSELLFEKKCFEKRSVDFHNPYIAFRCHNRYSQQIPRRWEIRTIIQSY